MNPIRSLTPKALLGFLPLALLANPPAQFAHGHAPTGPVAGVMELTGEGGELRATVTFTNHTSRVVWLEKLPDGEMPMRSEFEIRSEDGRMVPYRGPMAKRGAFTRADFHPLEPGHTSKREIRIDDRYDFPEGQKTYRATFSYLYWNLHTRQAVSRSLPSVKFSYTR